MQINNQEIIKKLYSNKTISQLKEINTKKELNTGISYIDESFGFPTGYYILIGNPGSGKSWFALWLTRMFYRHDQMRSVYFSLEMPEPMVRKRILQQWSDLSKSEIDSGKSVQKAIEMMDKDIIIVDEFYAEDTKHQTPENFKMWVDEYYKLGYRVFHFDHFHELQGASVNDTNQKVVEKWGLMFQQLCKQYSDIWLIIYTQPKSADAKRKILRRDSVLGSKALTYKCDYILSLNRNIEIDDQTGIVMVDDNEREIILYLDKTRYTEKTHVGFKIYFSETGNYYSITKKEND